MDYKFFVVMQIGVISSVCAAGTYTDKYDNVNLDEVLNNERLYRNYFNCLQGKGKCTLDGAILKEVIPSALKTDCALCSVRQKKGAEKVLIFLITKKPDDFKILEDKFDPEGVYRKKYEAQRKLVEEGKPIH
uniref:Chemosensory protein 5 n=1 Tax=Adelphocoris suturalis TaxID=323751 RepID=A0A166IGY1_9HEMI|nr:chemosensory protein 5 [Adelphocoris suturalis]